MKSDATRGTWQVDGFGTAVRTAAAPLLIWALLNSVRNGIRIMISLDDPKYWTTASL